MEIKLPTLEDRRKLYKNKSKKPFSFNCYDSGWEDCIRTLKKLNPELVDKRNESK